MLKDLLTRSKFSIAIIAGVLLVFSNLMLVVSGSRMMETINLIVMKPLNPGTLKAEYIERCYAYGGMPLQAYNQSSVFGVVCEKWK